MQDKRLFYELILDSTAKSSTDCRGAWGKGAWSRGALSRGVRSRGCFSMPLVFYCSQSLGYLLNQGVTVTALLN